jgi:amidase
MNDIVEYTPPAGELAYTFGTRPPVAHLKPGQMLRVRTQDCFGGAVRGPQDFPSMVCEFPYLNPVSGPFHLEGAKPGDTLALHFVSITPATDRGVSSTFPHFGALTSTHTTATLQGPLEERVWMYDIDTAAETVRYHASHGDHTVELPLEPMHGTVGVAPAGFEARSTLTCDTHGGNLDTPEIHPGSTLYLPVNVPGALFALGDGHARQGQGEAYGVAVECAMTTTLVVDLVKGTPTPWPRLETDQALMSIGCARPLEDAYRIAHTDLVYWTAALTGMDVLDAYQLISQAGTAPVGNVCDPNYTMLARIPKAYLPSHNAYSDVHQRLRAVARSLTGVRPGAEGPGT